LRLDDLAKITFGATLGQLLLGLPDAVITLAADEEKVLVVPELSE
jgi:hypothetical protein